MSYNNKTNSYFLALAITGLSLLSQTGIAQEKTSLKKVFAKDFGIK